MQYKQVLKNVKNKTFYVSKSVRKLWNALCYSNF